MSVIRDVLPYVRCPPCALWAVRSPPFPHLAFFKGGGRRVFFTGPKQTRLIAGNSTRAAGNGITFPYTPCASVGSGCGICEL